MGAIRWLEDDHTDTMGYLGKVHICTIEDRFIDDEAGERVAHPYAKWLVFHAAFPGRSPEYGSDFRFPCTADAVAREFAEGCLNEWFEETGITADHDRLLTENAEWLRLFQESNRKLNLIEKTSREHNARLDGLLRYLNGGALV